jgi:DNA-binding CsgD family transcriptional regulator
LEIKNWVSNEDLQILFEIINNSFLCKSDEDYNKLIEQLKRLIPFNQSISALLDLRHVSYKDFVNKSINSGYPLEYLKIYSENNYHLKDPLFLRFFETGEIQNSNDIDGIYNYGPENPVFRLREDFGIRNSFLYGYGNHTIGLFTIISMSGQQIKNDQRTKMIMKYCFPFLVPRLLDLVPHNKDRDILTLTPAELEILNWIKEGKSSWEISLILHKSERCINFHISNILKNLDAMNRTHAVVKALENNLITI